MKKKLLLVTVGLVLVFALIELGANPLYPGDGPCDNGGQPAKCWRATAPCPNNPDLWNAIECRDDGAGYACCDEFCGLLINIVGCCEEEQ